MLARQLAPAVRQRLDAQPDVLADALLDGVNLAVWQRGLPEVVAGFAVRLLASGESLAQSLTLEIENEAEPSLQALAGDFSALPGHAEFVADVAWLVRAYACLLEARRIGLRLRVLDKAMCPRFHVDHVPLRLVTTYAGVGSQWLEEGAMDRRRLGDPDGEPSEGIRQIETGHVALLKGEKWIGNEGAGLIHRSPQPAPGERRLLLTLDWLG